MLNIFFLQEEILLARERRLTRVEEELVLLKRFFFSNITQYSLIILLNTEYPSLLGFLKMLIGSRFREP